MKIDYVFDSVGGKDIERDTLHVLKKKGTFLTVCGPVQYIGSRKLSWVETINMFAYVIKRSIISKWSGPRYKFSEKLPRLVIEDMLNYCLKYGIKMPIDKVIDLDVEEIRSAIRYVRAHKAVGRVVIDIETDN
jgi:NADPH:quinone reductase-like Zn-dependent oxidoreductase